MASAEEVLRGEVATLRRQVAVLRECARTRGDLWDQLRAVCAAPQPPPADWAAELQMRVERDEAAAQRALCAASDEDIAALAGSWQPAAAAAAQPPETTRVVWPRGTPSAAAPAPPSGDPLAAADVGACVDELMAVSARLARVWQDELREAYQVVADEVADAFRRFDAAPSDASLQVFLRRAAELEGELRGVAAATDAEGDDGNPFCGAGGAGAAGLREHFADRVKQAAAAAAAAQLQLSAGGLAELRRAAAAAEERAEAAERELRRAQQSAAELSRRAEALEQEAAAARAAAGEAERQHKLSAAELAVRRSVPPGSGTPRRGSAPGATPVLQAGTPLRRSSSSGTGFAPPGASPCRSDASSAPQLRATLGHLEAQLAAACAHGHASEARHGHLRRRLELLRSELARAEGRAPASTRPF